MITCITKDVNKMLNKKEFDILSAYAMNKSSEEKVPERLLKNGLILNGTISAAGLEELEKYKVKRAVFIAAGFGSRLVPITLNTPKPLVRVHGKRIIDGLIDACLQAGINDIVIVRGYLGEEFDQLKSKYPMIKFMDNPYYKECNNISSAYIAKELLSNAYVFEADLLISNPEIICPYHYESNFLAIKTDKTDDWCFTVNDGYIEEEKTGGTDCWQMVGISYWSKEDGQKLARDIDDVFSSAEGKKAYWEQVPLVYKKANYKVAIKECHFSDIIEIDTFDELKAIDKAYSI